MLYEIVNSVITTNVDVNNVTDRCCCIGKGTIDQFSFSLTSSVLDHQQIRGNERVARVQHIWQCGGEEKTQTLKVCWLWQTHVISTTITSAYSIHTHIHKKQCNFH